MKKGSLIENFLITDIASNGKAIGRHEGQVIFVDRLVPGDVVDIQVFKKRRKYAEGRVVKLVKESDKRTEARCKHFGVCGGCKWQHLTYADQLGFKQNHVEENLKKLSGIKLPEIQTILPSDDLFEYRNKMEYTFSNSRWLTEDEIKSEEDFDHRNALGFHVPGRFDKIVDIEACHLQDDIANKIRNFVKAYALENKISFFDLRAQTGILRNLIIRNCTTGDLMIILSVTEYNDSVTALLEALKSEFSVISSLNYVVNSKKNDTISDLEVVCYAGKDHIMEQMKDLQYKIGPKSFFQTNSKQAVKLYDLVKEMADLQGHELVYDLYTGTGTIANYIAGQAKKVIGLEYIEEAVADARVNAEINEIKNTEFYAGDMHKILVDDFFNKHGYPDVIVTDPPRAGMHGDVVEKLNQSNAKVIVYVSCNPATQARDLELMDAYYEVIKLQPVDMFPHTAHVENVALLRKRT